MKYKYQNRKVEEPKDFPEKPWQSFDMSQKTGRVSSSVIRNAMANPDEYFETKGEESGYTFTPVYVFHSATQIFECSTCGLGIRCPGTMNHHLGSLCTCCGQEER